MSVTLVKLTSLMGISSRAATGELRVSEATLFNWINSLGNAEIDGSAYKVIPNDLVNMTVAQALSLHAASVPPLLSLPPGFQYSPQGLITTPSDEFLDFLDDQNLLLSPTISQTFICPPPYSSVLAVTHPDQVLDNSGLNLKRYQRITISNLKKDSVYAAFFAVESPLGRAVYSLSFKANKKEGGRQQLKLAYFSTYEDAPFVLNDYFSYLAFCKSLCDRRIAYSNLMSIVQGSGFGKSKLAYEAGCGLLSVILSGENPTGYPTESATLSRFLTLLKSIAVVVSHTGDVSLYIVLIHNFLIRVCFYSFELASRDRKGILFRENPKIDILYGFQEYAVSRSYHVYGNSSQEHQLILIPDANNEITTTSLEECFVKIVEMRENAELPPAIVYIDEASCLMKEYTSFDIKCMERGMVIDVDFLKLFRKAAEYTTFFRSNIFVCLISTASLTSNVKPTPEVDYCWRPEKTEIKLLPSFHLVQNFDVFIRSRGIVRPDSWINFVNGCQRMVTTFICGRPLFGMMASGVIMDGLLAHYDLLQRTGFIPPRYLADAVKMFVAADASVESVICRLAPTIIQNCAKKYLPRIKVESRGSNEGAIIDCIKEGFDRDPQPAIASWIILALSIVSFHTPDFVDSEDIIRTRMGIFLAMESKSKRHAMIYTSEGQSNAMGSWVLNSNLSKILKSCSPETFSSLMDTSVNLILDSGQVGELVARIGLLLCMLRTPYMDARKIWSKMGGTLYAPRSVFDFVESLAGRTVREKLEKARPDLDGALTCFNHFQASDELGSPVALAEAMLVRGSARLTPRGWHGADVLIPMVLRDGRRSMIIVQVKRKKKVPSFSDVFAKAQPENVFATVSYEDDGSGRKRRKMVLDEQSIDDIRTLDSSYLIICLNVAEKASELSPSSLETERNSWEVYDPQIEGVLPGLKCAGLSFAMLEESERVALASFCRLANSLELVRRYNPQSFAHLGCPTAIGDEDDDHPMYPYTVAHVRAASQSQQENSFMSLLADANVVGRTASQRGKNLADMISRETSDEAKVKAANITRSFHLPSQSEFYEKIHWDYFQNS